MGKKVALMTLSDHLAIFGIHSIGNEEVPGTQYRLNAYLAISDHACSPDKPFSASLHRVNKRGGNNNVYA